MALMFQRLAQNYAKNGYFPTDSETTQRLINALQPSEYGTLRILDPCCGEGVILAECKQALGVDQTIAYAVEYNKERAWHGKKLLDYCIHGDLNDCVLGARSFGFLLLNPPYGDMVSDKNDYSSKRERLEKVFYRKTHGLLQYGGVMALIIPCSSLDKEYSTWIAKHFVRVTVFEAPEKLFNQIVIMGVKQSTKDVDGALRDYLVSVGNKEIPLDTFPEKWIDEPYVVPASCQKTLKFYSIRIDQAQLLDVINKEPNSLWSRRKLVFHYVEKNHRRPLRKLSEWHLALALAAGQIFGIVKSSDNRIFIIKGDTFKEKNIVEEMQYNRKGEVVGTKRISTDRFVPTIRALDFTPNSPSFGCSFIIK
ncbi:FIG023873: Plasmid related protein [hydrothermal vent metagenome]|uniref:FIG023873: Plasmid related protein n=1 Tax=hydrothermal vent metagenome TaxID=652676 RepID=A0A3B0Y8J0_9ZZZZ